MHARSVIKAGLGFIPRKMGAAVEVDLVAGDVLYIPPFWIHEVQ
jgi:oxalate decarboxylase/phosphoglucose isomerase-like protein (cupin superfamily)